jgi:hypothetical protein
MDGLDHGFGLMPDNAGATRLEADWASFCANLDVATSPDDGGGLARALAARPECAADAARVFAQVANGVGVDGAADRLTAVLASVIATLPPAALQRVVTSMSVGERKPFLAALTPVLPPFAVLALCTATGAAFDRPLSAPLLRLLQKLRSEAETAAPHLRSRADQAFRALALHMVDSWAAATVNASASSFDSLFQQQAVRTVTRVTPEPLRVVQLSLESGAIGNVVWGAVAEQTKTEDGMRAVFDMLKRMPEGNEAVGAIAGHLATPARLGTLLREDPVDLDAVDVLIQSMGVNAIRPLIDELAEAKLRSTRRAIMDRLARMGPQIGPFVMERMDDNRWYVVRNMIALMREAGCDLGNLPVEKFRTHADARVRRETLQLQLENPADREKALVEALGDADRHVLRTALQAARSDLPESAVPVLARRVTDADFPPEFRVIALFLLGRSGSIHALEPLLAFVEGGKSLFGKPKLAAKSPEMLAALGGLARSWPNERRTAALLDVARASKDDQILNALKTTPQPS